MGCRRIACLLLLVLPSLLAAEEPPAKLPPVIFAADYGVALDRVGKDVVDTLVDHSVLLIWCFDLSESTADDRADIRKRLPGFYGGIEQKLPRADLTTLVCGFGERLLVQTLKPTGELKRIQDAISQLPHERNGKERMCSAIGRCLAAFRKQAKADARRIIFVVVTDESGEPDDNRQFLEPVIAAAKKADCRVHMLAPAAEFASPHAFVRWRHPQTRRMHWVPFDRGPETAFIELLQGNGLRPRLGSLSSGFGPYDQMRLAGQTGGTFLMMPFGVSLGRPEPPYKQADLEGYEPDLRSRAEIVADNNRHPLRAMLNQAVQQLNPKQPKSEFTYLRSAFPVLASATDERAAAEQEKIEGNLKLLEAAEQALAGATDHRQREPSRRWQANYDLTLGQLAAFRARTENYRALLNSIDDTLTAPLEKGKLRLDRWDVVFIKQDAGPGQPHAERARKLLQAAVSNHPNTPWARAADLELRRGFGVELRPHYDVPGIVIPNAVPIPKF